ncbi:MAG: enoyl-ACP reductase [Planctomycetes bacterium]|nr:enoyl-ACP reductase [Planctomycetota bacterium]
MLQGKKGIVLGVANKRSIAWAIAKKAADAGASVALTYQDERLLEKVKPLADELPAALLLRCDVSQPEQMDQLFRELEQSFGKLDFLVHALAFAKREELEGEYLQTSPEGFEVALRISAYSLTDLARRAAPLMKDGGSIVTLSYLGGERVIPHYNVMGVAKAALESSVRYLASDLGPRNIRVNTISAGPIRTLAAAGISGFSSMLDVVAERSFLKRNVTVEEVGDTAVFLLSDLSRGMTGELLHVDCGYHATGM